MPIVDVEIVASFQREAGTAAAPALADALGSVFGSAPGRTWVRLRTLESGCYAENRSKVAENELPVFVTVLHARPPGDELLPAEVAAVTQAVSACLGISPDRVHVEYAPPAVGRQAFGGKLIK